MVAHRGNEILKWLESVGLSKDAGRRFLESRTGEPFDPDALYTISVGRTTKRTPTVRTRDEASEVRARDERAARN